MARTLTASQEAQRLLRGVKGIWLCQGTFDQYGIADTVKRYGSRALTLSGNAWSDLLARGGLRLEMLRLKQDGGLCAIPGFAVRIRDESGESAASSTHTLSGDEVILYWLLYTAGVTASDLIELARGIVEQDEVDGQVWQWQVKDASTAGLRLIPADTLNPTTYPFAWVPGAPVPECWGNCNCEPRTYPRTPLLAPARYTDKWAMEVTGSLYGDQPGDGQVYVWQWYEQAKAWAEQTAAPSSSGGIHDFADPGRQMWLYPARAHANNTVADWYRTVGDDSDYCTVGIADTLRVWLSGAAKCGTLTMIRVSANGDPSTPVDHTVSVYDDTTLIGTSTGTGDVLVALNVSDYAQWDLSLLNVEVVPAAGAPVNINNIFLYLTFDDFVSFSDTEPRIYCEQRGFRDLAAYYHDGAAVYSEGAVLRNPVHQLAAMLRAEHLHALPTAQVSATHVAAAFAYRASWYFDWWMDPDAQQREDLLDRLAYDAGCWLFQKGGQWRVVAKDSSTPPSLFLLGHYHCPVAGGRLVPPYEYDIRVRPMPASRIYNEVAIRYKPHPATGEYRGLTVSSGMYRLTGTCDLSMAAGTLTDATGTFVTDGVVALSADGPGERVYCEGDVTYEVTAVNSETELAVSPVAGGPVSDLTGATYYLGPSLDGTCFVSQRSYKVTNALGGSRQQTFLQEGGYRTDFVWDDDTAEAMRDLFVEWGAPKRWLVELAAFHFATKLEEGDVFLLDHERLPTHLQGVDLCMLAEDIDGSETVWDVDYPSACRAGDYLYVQSGGRDQAPECVLVASRDVPGGTITVTRGRLGTAAATHSTGDTLVRCCDHAWVCTGLRPPTPDEPVWRIEAELMPDTYLPQGVVAPIGAPAYSAATAAERLRSGFACYRNGRVDDYDLYSDISWVGPDTGTYPV